MKKLYKLGGMLALTALCPNLWAQTDGTYYLYNTATKTFLSRGANYGTEAVTDAYGVPVEWNSSDATLKLIITSNAYVFDTSNAEGTGGGMYVDGSSDKSKTWTFEVVSSSDETYYLQNKTTKNYVKQDYGDYGAYLHTVTSKESAVVWKLMSAAERDAIVDAYPNDNMSNVISSARLTGVTYENFVSTITGSDYKAIDMTSKIGTAKFTGSAGSWTWKSVREGGQYNGTNYGTNYAEVFRRSGTFTQKITDLPQGIYKVTVKGFNRISSYKILNDLGEDYKISTSYLQANKEAVQLKSWIEERTETSNPDNTNQAVAKFEAGNYANEVYTYVDADGILDLSVHIPTWNNDGSWTLINDFTLTRYADVALLKEQFASLKTENSTLQDLVNVATKTSLETALNTANAVNVESASIDELNAAITALEAAVIHGREMKAAYTPASELLSIANAIHTNSIPNVADDQTTFGTAISTAQTSIDAATTTAALTEATATLEAARQAYVKVAYPTKNITFDMTFMAGTTQTNWSGADKNYTTGDGVAMVERYYNPAAVGVDFPDANTIIVSQSLSNMPKGVYEVELYAHASYTENRGFTSPATEGENVAHVYANSITNSVPMETQTKVATAKSYTLSDVVVGNGGSLQMGLVSDKKGANWFVAQVKSIKLVSDASDEQALLADAKALLADAKAIDVTTNVGVAAFQKPQDMATALTNAIAVVETSATTENVAALKTAIDNFNNAALNVPEDGKRFTATLTYTGYEHDNKAITYVEGGNPGKGDYGISYLKAVDTDYAQAFTFTATSEKDIYTMNMIDVDGKERFLCTGTVYTGGNAREIRTTTDATKAVKLQLIATSKAGVYNLKNMEANDYIGSQDAGVYTVNSHIDFIIAEAATADVTLSVTDAGWATLMLPFNAEIPEGLTVYTIDGKGETTGTTTALTLNKATAIKANTPYVVAGTAKDYSFSGFGLAKQDTYTGTMATGTYAEMTEAIEGTYVLQNQTEGVNFYKVGAETKPAIGAYRAYLNALPAESNILVMELPNIDVTGVETVKSADDIVNVYNLNGVVVREGVKRSAATQGLVKGIYVIGGVKQAVK